MSKITIPNNQVATCAVVVHFSSSSCMNCGHNYVGGNKCRGCNTRLVYAVESGIPENLLDKFASEHSLTPLHKQTPSGWIL